VILGLSGGDSSGRELLAKIPPRTDFETNPYRETLEEIRTCFSVLKRTIDELIDLLYDARGNVARSLPERLALKVSQVGGARIYHMERLLCTLIMRGVSQSFVQKAFALRIASILSETSF
jgi:hypothetical protein